jgi:plasmid stabilization system protein ParE
VTYSFLVKAKADADMRAAKRWYDDQRPGLGDEFIEEVLRAFEVIQRNPLAAPIRCRGTRRIAVKRFPYGVFYRLGGNQIRVVAVYHDKREPKGWKSRN